MQLQITGTKGFHAIMDNGITLSVQIGSGNYCDNQTRPFDARPPLPPSRTAEIAVWVDGGGMLEFPNGDTVSGWVDVAAVFAAIPELAALRDFHKADVVSILVSHGAR